MAERWLLCAKLAEDEDSLHRRRLEERSFKPHRNLHASAAAADVRRQLRAIWTNSPTRIGLIVAGGGQGAVTVGWYSANWITCSRRYVLRSHLSPRGPDHRAPFSWKRLAAARELAMKCGARVGDTTEQLKSKVQRSSDFALREKDCYKD